jgi:hypothetical protein
MLVRTAGSLAGVWTLRDSLRQVKAAEQQVFENNADGSQLNSIETTVWGTAGLCVLG